jgi:hypothetical protein
LLLRVQLDYDPCVGRPRGLAAFGGRSMGMATATAEEAILTQTKEICNAFICN